MQKETLYKRRSDGNLQQWTIGVENLPNGQAVIVTEHGKVGGSLQTDRNLISKGKNIGRSNETTAQEQAVLMANRKWQSKYDNGERADPSKIVSAQELRRPMLAHSYEKRGHTLPIDRIAYQPKLDGLRVLAIRIMDRMIYLSRGGKHFTTLVHLDQPLLNVLKNGEAVDGELYVHGRIFEWITSRVKKYREGETEQIQLWIYDLPDTTLTFEERNAKIRSMKLSKYEPAAKYETPLIEVETVWVTTDKAVLSFIEKSAQSAKGKRAQAKRLAEMAIILREPTIKKLHDGWTQDGFEGLMLRDPNSMYVYGKRIAGLQKHKMFFDEEYTIVDAITPDFGRDMGAIMFVCAIETGETFTVRPRGKIELRKEQWIEYQLHPERFIGKPYTVRFQELTVNNIPRFPVGINIRDYE
jgi:ATP-dependent DNA ligase